MSATIEFVKITETDDAILSKVIKEIFIEFGIDRPGTVYTDPTTDHLSELFQNPQSVYWVAKENGNILGGCGIFPTEGLPDGHGELVKFYLAKESRGKGIGNSLMQRCFQSAKELGYTHLYLESFAELGKAVSLYERNGFSYLPHSLGNSGHFACTIWMEKRL